MLQSISPDAGTCAGNVAGTEVIANTTGGRFEACAVCGNWLASSASGGSSHNWNARSGPNRRRHDLRNTATSSTATVNARISSQPRPSQSIPAHSILFIVELLEQLAQFGDVLLRQLALLGEVHHQRCHAAAEQAIEQALALLLHVLSACQQGRVEVAATVALGMHRLFPQQAVEQGFHRAFLPVLR